MKGLLIAVASSFFSLALVAQEIPEEHFTPPPGSQFAKTRERLRAKSGGVLPIPNSRKGQVVVLNAQKRVAESNLVAQTQYLRGATRLDFNVKSVDPASVVKADCRKLKADYEANALVLVLDDGDTPDLLVAPSEQWAIVNVAMLARDLKSESSVAKFLPLRTTRQVLRALAQISGSVTQFRNSPASIKEISDLDFCGNMLPIDQLQNLCTYLNAHGVCGLKFASYRRACKEGWAPAPTNDIQKAVWNEVHTIPSKPLKIEFDPSRDRK